MQDIVPFKDLLLRKPMNLLFLLDDAGKRRRCAGRRSGVATSYRM
jgi:hypothetical protein